MKSARRSVRALLLAFSLSLHTSAWGAVATLDLPSWNQGETSFGGWTQQGLDWYKTDPFYGAVYFNGAEDRLVSPTFVAPIISVTVEVGMRNAEWTRRPVLSPLVEGLEQDGQTLEVAVAGEYVQQTVSLVGRGIRRFCLKSSAGSGTWALRKVIVVFGDDEPIVPPGPAWRLSEFLPKPGERSADFAGLAVIGKLTEWTNGTDGDRLHAFANESPVTFIRPATDKSVYGGLYCFSFERGGGTERALALLGSGSTDVWLMLPVKLDAERPIENLSVSYVARQVKAGEAANTVLSFAWATLSDIGQMNGAEVVWQAVPEAAYLAAHASEERVFQVPVRSLRTAPYVCFRWSVPKQANSAMIGISDISLRGKLQTNGLFLSVR